MCVKPVVLPQEAKTETILNQLQGFEMKVWKNLSKPFK